jgi:putative glutamine amidotransferase
MAICRGEQLMNVVLGGSLYQDIPTQVDTTVIHAGGALHRIGVEKGSVLYALFGQDSLTVNSYHHQAVKDTGTGVRIVARAADGVVEAWEWDAPQRTGSSRRGSLQRAGSSRRATNICVQFHPEEMIATGDTTFLPIFQDFIDRAR